LCKQVEDDFEISVGLGDEGHSDNVLHQLKNFFGGPRRMFRAEKSTLEAAKVTERV
jgi:hypothetical protein